MPQLELATSRESSLIRKGDIFTVILNIKNDTNKPIKLCEAVMKPPYGFKELRGKMKKFREMIKMLDIRIGEIPKFSIRYDPPMVLQPDDTHSDTFDIKCSYILGLNPRPDSYTMSANIKYNEDGIDRHETKEINVDIHPSNFTVLLGCMLGGLLGALIKFNFLVTLDLNHILNALASIIFAIVAGIVFLKRKKVQNLITVEDWMGGMLVGFLAGYGGIKFLESILPISAY